ncbi:proprotein convertase P-domain-containing protein, partial [Patiriisocius hiemis]
MKKITFILMALMVTSFTWQLNAQSGTISASSIDPAASWADGTTGAAVASLTADVSGIPANAIVEDVNLLLEVDHSWTGDMDVTLVSPDGNTVLVVDNVCANDSNFNVTLDDESANPLTCGGYDTAVSNSETCPSDYLIDATLSGDMQASNLLSALDGDLASGTWTVNIDDNVGGDGGCFHGFTVTVDWAVPPPCAPDNPQPINDFTPVSSVINVAGMGVVGAMTDQNTFTSLLVEAQHDRVGDLVMTLTSPAGTVLELSSNNGDADGLDIQDTISFVDGQPNITTWVGGAPDAAGYEAEGGSLMATFAGEPIAGDWTLTIEDGGLGDEGTLENFCLEFTNNGVVGTPPTISCPADVTITTDDDGAGDCTA